MRLHAGLDRSGTPDLTGLGRGHDPYTITLVAFEGTDENWTTLRDGLQRVRQEYPMPKDKEFGGHETTDRMQAAVLAIVLALQFRVAALLIDKKVTHEKWGLGNLPSPLNFQADTALALLEQVVPTFQLAWLWCDEDVKGRKQHEFTTAVKRIHRAAWPGERIKVKHIDSRGNELVQIADIVAYGLAGMARGETMGAELRRCLLEIRNDPMNIIIGPVIWKQHGLDPRPYP
jgi:hypothetical protein